MYELSERRHLLACVVSLGVVKSESGWIGHRMVRDNCVQRREGWRSAGQRDFPLQPALVLGGETSPWCSCTQLKEVETI